MSFERSPPRYEVRLLRSPFSRPRFRCVSQLGGCQYQMNMTQGQETGTKRLSRGLYQVAVPGTSCVLNVEPVGFVLFARILVLPELPLAHYVV